MTVTATSRPVPCNLCGSVEIDELGNRDRDGRSLRTTIGQRRGLVWSNPRHFAHFWDFNRVTLEAPGRKAGFEPVQTTTSLNGGNLY